jgi:hypothetical protein
MIPGEGRFPSHFSVNGDLLLMRGSVLQGESFLTYLKRIPMDEVVLPEGDDFGIPR